MRQLSPKCSYIYEVKILSIQDFLEQSLGKCIIDVRSEGEFLKGHLRNANSLPLFNNEERAKVGTTYKQVGKEQAILEGLEIVGPKMANIIRTVNDLSSTKDVFLYCWRGGMRSSSVGWLLETAGYTVHLLKGGYKSYRRLVNSFLDNTPLKLKVIGGCTGSGKTDILQKLKERGEQTIDLEQLAHHKGSAFGALGQPEAPTQEDFDNKLFDSLYSLDPTKPIWIEDESKNIGRIFIPLKFFAMMLSSPVYSIHVLKEDRIERLVKEYAIHPKADLEASMERIKKRLGGQTMKDCLQALEENNFKYFAELVLFYYDRTYIKHLEQKKERIVKKVEVVGQDYDTAVEELLRG